LIKTPENMSSFNLQQHEIAVEKIYTFAIIRERARDYLNPTFSTRR
jgi:hypothetical protein